MIYLNTAKAFNRLAKYYDVYVKGFGEDIKLYSSFCEENDKILEVGCGTGRVIKALVEKGLNDITGIDISDEMLKTAKNKLNKHIKDNNLSLEKHDFSIEPLKRGFDKVFVTYYTFNYIMDDPDKFLKNIYLSMKSNSLIVIDLFYPLLFLEPELDGVWIEREIKYESNKTLKVRSKKSFDGTFERRILTFSENGSTTTIESERRFYYKEEIEKLLHETGFRNIKIIYGYSLGDTTEFAREEVKSNFVAYAYKPL